VYLQVLVLVVLLAAKGAWGEPHRHTMKLRVHFLATSTSIHTGEGRDQDVYLIELETENSDSRTVLARLVDEYPSFRAAIATNILRSDGSTILRLRRDTTCDIALKQMPLRTAPGDPEAILPERLGFDPQLPSTTDLNMTLPCYRLVRR
jgi:hypothetical protein